MVNQVAVVFLRKKPGKSTKQILIAYLPASFPFPSPLFHFLTLLSIHFSRGQNRKSPSSVFLCSETKRKRLLRRLAVSFQVHCLKELNLLQQFHRLCVGGFLPSPGMNAGFELIRNSWITGFSLCLPLEMYADMQTANKTG